MKREEILLYLSVGKVRLYFINAKDEYIFEEDTSLFFEYGEISNEKLGEEFFLNIFNRINLGLYYIKPNVHVLYNDVAHADVKFLYECVLKPINYNKIDFVPLTKLVSKIRKKDEVVVYDEDYYTLVGKLLKVENLDDLDFEPVIMGCQQSDCIHYANLDILWDTLKTCFTKGQSYGIIESGDD